MRSPPISVSKLTSAADSAIFTVLSSCAGPPAKGEVATVAKLIVHGVPAIAAAWKPLLAASGCSLTMTGVFCHGSPYVSFAGASPPPSCELADLLIVMDYISTGTIDRQAVLVQAKMAKGGSVAIGTGGAAKQLHLLQNWPAFTFNSSRYDPRPRDLGTAIGPPATSSEAGRYGGIDLTLGSEQWRQFDPLAPRPFGISGGASLGKFMAKMVDGALGAGVIAAYSGWPAPAGADDWSFTIAELLTVTYALNHAAIRTAGSTSGVRGTTAIAYSHQNIAATGEWRVAATGEWRVMAIDAPPDGPSEPGFRPPHNGISFIHGEVDRR